MERIILIEERDTARSFSKSETTLIFAEEIKGDKLFHEVWQAIGKCDKRPGYHSVGNFNAFLTKCRQHYSPPGHYTIATRDEPTATYTFKLQFHKLRVKEAYQEQQWSLAMARIISRMTEESASDIEIADFLLDCCRDHSNRKYIHPDYQHLEYNDESFWEPI